MVAERIAWSHAVIRCRSWIAESDFQRDMGVGLTVALVTLVNSIAYSSFLASGRIANLLPTILASALVATGVMSVVLTRFHSRASALGGPAGNAAAVVGAALTSVIAHDSNAGSRSADVAIVLALSALLPGVAMFVLWRLRLAHAIRYLPYPVFAGFLAGTGWLLVTGSARIADAPATLAASIVFAAILRIAQARWKSPLLIPVAVLGATLIVHLYLTVENISLDSARAAHWLYPQFGMGSPAIVTPSALVHANWGAIASSWSAFAWITIVVILVSMMNTVALEAETGADTDVDRDLAAIGAASIAAGVCGGFGSQLLLPSSVLAMKGSPGSRLPGYVVALGSLLALAVAVAAIPYLPKPVFGGLIAFIGIRLLEQHALGALRTMGRPDAFAVFAVLLTTMFAGLPAGLAVGLVVAGVLSIAATGRQDVIARWANLRDYRSGRERRPEHRFILDRDGAAIHIVQLRGQLFFGSVSAMYEMLKLNTQEQVAPNALVLEFADVSSVDVSAALTFAKIVRYASRRGMSLSFSALEPAFERVLRKNGALSEGSATYATLRDALEACEDVVIERAGYKVTTELPPVEITEHPDVPSHSRHASCDGLIAGVLAPV